jgi:hypothetical protein
MPAKMGAPTLTSALNYYLQRADVWKLTEADRAFLKRWLNEARDPVWQQLAAATNGEFVQFQEGPYSCFVSSALHARRFAGDETDPLQRKRKQQREQQECLELLALADELEQARLHYRACSKAHELRQVPSPRGPLPPTPRELEEKRSLHWLERTAHRLRQSAERLSASEPNLEWGRIPVHISRQSGGKGKRDRSRELRVFMQKMVNCMYEWCGKPRYHAVATITNIAFSHAHVVADNVRSACRPTTRAARGRRTQSVK